MARKAPSKPSQQPRGTRALERLKEFYEFMRSHGLERLELDDDDLHVRLVRKPSEQAPVPVPVFVGPAAGAAAASAPAAAAQRAAAQAAPAGSETIKAPMMGIFYRASTPSAPPYAKDGERVASGQVICMIEAMKVFNEIKADFDCTVLRALVENGKPVKSGQDLFLIKR
jgi:acetyl-CoA carboxylase biotin carboxyl carrier protein